MQDLITKVREHEEEIAQLRKHVADYSVKVRKMHPNIKVYLLW